MNEDCWKDLRDDAIAGIKTLHLEIYGPENDPELFPVIYAKKTVKKEIRPAKLMTMANFKIPKSIRFTYIRWTFLSKRFQYQNPC